MELQNDLNSNSNVTPGSVSVNYSDDAVCWKLFMKKPKAITTRSYSESNSSTSDSYNNTNSSTTGSNTRSVNKTTSKFTVYHYRLLFTPVHNDTTARWPTTHLLKNVKKWTLTLVGHKSSEHPAGTPTVSLLLLLKTPPTWNTLNTQLSSAVLTLGAESQTHQMNPNKKPSFGSPLYPLLCLYFYLKLENNATAMNAPYFLLLLLTN